MESEVRDLHVLAVLEGARDGGGDREAEKGVDGELHDEEGFG